jgi:glycosyltransferase involved in cell wall biosynthesis
MSGSVTIAICAYNSESRIAATLRSLVKCELPGPSECLLIANNCTDKTVQVALETWQKYAPSDFPIRVIDETMQGLAFARKRAAREARYETVVYCDDDNHLHTDYLLVASELMSDGRIGAVSGVGLPVSSIGFPVWFYSFAPSFAVGLQRTEIVLARGGQLDITDSQTQCPWGAGLVIRKSLLLTIFNSPHFPLLSDRRGNTLTSGGDYELCHLVAASGKQLVVDGRLRFDHAIPPERLTLEYLSRLMDGMNAQLAGLKSYEVARSCLLMRDKNYVKNLLRSLARLLVMRASDSDKALIALAINAQNYLLSDEQRKAVENAIYVKNAGRAVAGDAS